MLLTKLKLEKLCIRVFCVLSTIFYIVLNLYAIKSSYHNYDLKDEIVTFTKDNVLLNVLFLVLCFLVFSLISFVSNKITNINTNKVAKIVSLIVVTIGLIWVTTLLSYPMADQEFVLFSSARIDAGDYSDLAKGGYLGMYQHQLGLVTYFRLLNRLFGNFNYRGAQLVNCFLGGLFTYSGYKITSLLSKENKTTELIYLLLVLFCMPFYGYMSYVYGEIPSIAFLALSFWMYLSINKENKLYKYLLLFLFLTISILLRQNYLIFVIGMLIVSAIKYIENYKEIKKILLCIVIVLSMISPSITTKLMYEKNIPLDSKPLPTMVWLAMGTNTDNEDCYGSWNNLPYDLLYKYDFDMDKCDEEAKNIFNEFVETCKNDKSYLVNFYIKKFVTQWNVPLYQSFVMSNVVSENLTPIAEDILYTGNNARAYSNIYQLLIYSACLIYVLTSGKYNDLNCYVILIGIFGGFVFSLLWEAKARYIFPYFMMMIPCSAIGIEIAISSINKFLKKC